MNKEFYVALHETVGFWSKNYPEIEDEWYSRQEVTLGMISTYNVGNLNIVLFTRGGKTTDRRIKVTHFSIWDAEEGGNLLEMSPLGAPRTLWGIDSLEFAVADIMMKSDTTLN